VASRTVLSSTELVSFSVDWIGLAQDRFKWTAFFVNAVMTLQVP
jgi:hypothetical protein